MPRFFYDKLSGNKASLSGEEANHIKKSFRMKPGDTLVLFNGKGYESKGVITKIDEKVHIELGEIVKGESEIDFNLHLYQCLPKKNKFEFIIQKAVELGIKEITPINSNRMVVKKNIEDFEKKRERYEKICIEACKQSGRSIIPKINKLTHFDQAVEESSNKKATNLIFYEGYGDNINKVLSSKSDIGIFIGNEGGFSEQEINFAAKNEFKICTLGKRILRCETAAIAAIAISINIMEHF